MSETTVKPEGFDIHRVIEYATGTPKSLDEVIRDLYGDEYDENILTSEDHETIDGEIFRCDTCGWWCEVSEMQDTGDESEQVCEDCHEDSGEEG